MSDPVAAEREADVTPARGAWRGLIVTLRPKQWVKNLFVLAPLFFSKQFLIPSQLLVGFGAALLFCLTAGTVYLFNDVADVDKDRRHPIKRHRPIPSGQLPVPMAIVAAATLGLGCLGAAMLLDWRLGVVTLIYLVMNLAYSMRLKHWAFVDVGIIATGFVLRVLAGAFAIGVFISEWLFLCTFLLAFYLGLGKRLHELDLVRQGKASQARKVLERYRYEHLDFGVLFVAGLTIAAYALYTVSASLPGQPMRAHATPFSSPLLPLTIPCAVFGITRFYQLLRAESLEGPTELLLRDVPFIVNLLVWGALMLVLTFLFPG